MKTLFKNIVLGNITWLILSALTVSNLFYDGGNFAQESADSWEWGIAIASVVFLAYTAFAPRSAEALFKRIFGY